MQTQTRKPLRAEAVMAIIAAIIALVLGVITWLSWPPVTSWTTSMIWPAATD